MGRRVIGLDVVRVPAVVGTIIVNYTVGFLVCGCFSGISGAIPCRRRISLGYT
jgi:hypothetical protein